ncbi:MAG: GNAT family N-acetyltransferase [Acidimicrobiia bacterium]|nr:GNAT family N-acetyltransferase [Acidimicrobiia bacterium]
MRIRALDHADVPRLVALLATLGYGVDHPELERRLGALGADDRLLVADDGGTPAGFVVARLDNHLAEGPAVEITSLVVDPAARRRGIGAALVGAVEAWARDRGRDRVRLRSNVVRDDAHAFYEAEGFAVVKRSTVFEKRID